METRYTVSLKKTDEGFSVWVPGLPGCASQGQSEKEALENIRDAIREYFAAAHEPAEADEAREVMLNTGDYTRDRMQWQKDLTVDQIIASLKPHQAT